MVGLKKKLIVLFIALASAVSLAAFMTLLPQEKASAADSTQISETQYLNIDRNGVFLGLTDKAFEDYGRTNFKLVLPDTVTAIGNGNDEPAGGIHTPPTVNKLFSNDNYNITQYLTAVEFTAPEKITSIGYRAFVNCTALESIDLSGLTNLTTLKTGVFMGCTSLKEATLPSGIDIPDFTFRGCSSLQSVNLSGTTAIGASAFLECSKLSSFSFGGIKNIGASAFSGCSSLTSVTLPDVETVGNTAFASCVNLAEVILPETLTIINDGVFQNCSKLSKVNSDVNHTFNLPANVTSVKKNAFSNCIALEEIVIPAKISTIELNAFSGLDGVKKIYYFAENVATFSAPFALSDSAYKRASVDVFIGDADHTVNAIPQGLFERHKAVKNVTFTNVKLTGEGTFGVNAFSNCEALEKLAFTDCTIPVINANAFSGCVSLRDIEGIEDTGLQTVKMQAFKDCKSLYTFTIGTKVSAIELNAFVGSERLIEVRNLTTTTLKAGDDTWGGVAKYAKHVYNASGMTKIEKSNGFVFYCDIGTSSYEVLLIAYEGADGTVTLPSSFTKNTQYYRYDVYQYAFYGNSDVTRIVIPNIEAKNGVQKIGKYAFAGCTSLQDVELCKGLQELGEAAFAGCTSLDMVDFKQNDTLSVISDNAFSGCTSLKSITLPAKVVTINSFAFNGCSALNTITFTKSGSKYLLKTIAGNAFAGCTSLVAVEIPSSVKSVGQKAFADCTALEFVYLPSDEVNGEGDVTQAVSYNKDIFSGCSEKLMLISSSKAQYDRDKNKVYYKYKDENADKEIEVTLGDFFKNKLTYIITVELIYNDGCIDGLHTTRKLHGQAGDYAQGSTLTWSATGSMPRQGGHVTEGGKQSQQYIISEWFKESSYTTHVDDAEFTKMLAEDVEKITLYARYFDQPELSVANAVSYEVGRKYTISNILTIFRENGTPVDADRAAEMMSNFNFSIISHRFVDGSADTGWNPDNKEITEAGVYELSISLPTDGKYGSWENTKTVEFEITAGKIDITDLLIWKPENGSLAPELPESGDKLNTTTLYFYDSTTTPFLEKVSLGNDNDGNPIYKTPTEQAQVANSYTVFSSREVEIRLAWKSDEFNYGEPIGSTYIKNKATEAGTYQASVVLRPNNNYIFEYRKDTATLNRLNTLGLSFEPEKNADGSETGNIIVRKTWYIVISKANQLISGDAGGGNFDIPKEWEYMSKDIPTRPTLSTIPGQASEILKFTFEYTDPDGNKVSFGNEANDRKISINSYEEYFNETMPAGKYVATFFIGEGRDNNGNIVTGDPAGTRFEFEIKQIPVTETDRNDVASKLKDGSVPYSDSKLGFLPTGDLDVLKKPQAYPKGQWNSLKVYYTPFAIKYRVVRAGEENPDPKYYTEEEYVAGNSDMVKPQAIGNYVIYYVISAPNYGGTIEGSYRLSITHALKPVLPIFDYQAVNVLNNVIKSLERSGLEYVDVYTMLDYNALDGSDSLKRETKSAPLGLRNMYMYNNNELNDKYVDVGEHHIFLRIKDEYSTYIVWDSSISTELRSVDGVKYLVLDVDIAASTNREVKALTIRSWQYHEFDSDRNSPIWELAFDHDYTKYEFILSNGTDTYYFYGDPTRTVEEGKSFNDAPVGKYILTAVAPGNTMIGYDEFTSECEAEVDKADLRFVTTPFIDSWNYGNYKPENIVPAYKLGGLGEEVASQIKVKYCTEAEYNKSDRKTYDIGTLLDSERQLPAGTYYLVYTLEETDNFQSWQYGVRFRVLRAENYWDKTPVIHDWVYGEYASSANVLEYKPHFGDVKSVQLQYKTAKSGWVDSIEKLNGFDSVTRELAVGTYDFRAVVPVSNNYNELEFRTTFTVTRTANSWEEVPGIVGWAEGKYTAKQNSPYSKAKFGTNSVVYTVTDEEGNEYDITKLGSLAIGSYKLTATIAGNDNYDTLSSVVYFNVVEDSVGMTGLMIATIIFSVLALGLAAAGVTLLVLRSRRAEAEFRRTIKNELRRK